MSVSTIALLAEAAGARADQMRALTAAGIVASTPDTPSGAYVNWSAAERERYHSRKGQDSRVYRPDYGTHAAPTVHTPAHREVEIRLGAYGGYVLCKDCRRKGVARIEGTLV